MKRTLRVFQNDFLGCVDFRFFTDWKDVGPYLHGLKFKWPITRIKKRKRRPDAPPFAGLPPSTSWRLSSLLSSHLLCPERRSPRTCSWRAHYTEGERRVTNGKDANGKMKDAHASSPPFCVFFVESLLRKKFLIDFRVMPFFFFFPSKTAKVNTHVKSQSISIHH